jgi:hypothetical protein
VVVATGAAAYGGYARLRSNRWAHAVALPEIRRLADVNQFDSAFTIAMRARDIIGDDSSLASLMPRVSANVLFRSTPAGARVFRTTYDDSTQWTELGVTPTDSVRVPRGFGRYRFELPGHHPVQLAGMIGLVRNARVVLHPLGSPNAGMVYVTGGNTEVARSRPASNCCRTRWTMAAPTTSRSSWGGRCRRSAGEV